MKRMRRFGAKRWCVSSSWFTILLPVVLVVCACFIVWYWRQPRVRVMTGIRYLCDETAQNEASFLYGLDASKHLKQYINENCEMTGNIRISGMEERNITVNGDYVLRRDLENQKADLSMRVSVLRIPICEVEGYADSEKLYFFVEDYQEEGIAIENPIPLFERITTLEDIYGQSMADLFGSEYKNSWFKKHRIEIQIAEEGKGENDMESFRVQIPCDVEPLTCRVLLTKKNRVKEIEITDSGMIIRLYGDNLDTFEMIQNDNTTIKVIKSMPENEYNLTSTGVAGGEPCQIQGKMKIEYDTQLEEYQIILDDVQWIHNEKKRLQIDMKAKLRKQREEIDWPQDLEQTTFVEPEELLQLSQGVLK